MIDARGLSCPTPVIMVQRAVRGESPAVLEVLVDAQVAVENISRFAASAGYWVSAEQDGPDYRLTLTK